MTTIHLRMATIADSSFIATNVLEALGWEIYEKPSEDMVKMKEHLTTLCERKDTLYSWCNTLIAEYDGVPVGSLTGYNGADYQTLRNATFPALSAFTNYDFSVMEIETWAGEYYIDSLAVIPEYRGRGIAGKLIERFCEHCFAQDAPQVTLLVEPDNEPAKRLYASKGFQPEGIIKVFDHDYRRMIFKK